VTRFRGRPETQRTQRSYRRVYACARDGAIGCTSGEKDAAAAIGQGKA